MQSLETNVAVLSTSFTRSVGHREKNRKSHVFGLLVSSAFPVSLFKVFPSSNSVREVVYLGGCWWRQNLIAVVRTLPKCSDAASLRHCFRPDSRSAPRSIFRASSSVLEIQKCCNSWSIFSSHRILEGSTRRSAASSFLYSSLLVSQLNAPDERSPCQVRRLASDFSAPPHT